MTDQHWLNTVQVSSLFVTYSVILNYTIIAQIQNAASFLFCFDISALFSASNLDKNPPKTTSRQKIINNVVFGRNLICVSETTKIPWKEMRFNWSQWKMLPSSEIRSSALVSNHCHLSNVWFTTLNSRLFFFNWSIIWYKYWFFWVCFRLLISDIWWYFYLEYLPSPVYITAEPELFMTCSILPSHFAGYLRAAVHIQKLRSCSDCRFNSRQPIATFLLRDFLSLHPGFLDGPGGPPVWNQNYLTKK